MKSIVCSAACLLIAAQFASAQSPTGSTAPGVIHRSTPVPSSTQGPTRRATTTTPTSTVRSAVVGTGVAATHSTGAPTSISASSVTGQQATQSGVGLSGTAMSMQATGASPPPANQMRTMAPVPPSVSPTAGVAKALAAPARQGRKVTTEASTVRAPIVPETASPTRPPPSAPL